MKFEDLIKQKVAKHEEVYDPKAWETLSSKLDATSVVTKSTSSLKWVISAASVIAVALVSVLFYSKEPAKKHVEKENVVTADKNTPKTEQETTTKAEEKATTENSVETKITIQSPNSPTANNVKIKTVYQPTVKSSDAEKHDISLIESTFEHAKEPAIKPVVALNWDNIVCQNTNKILGNPTATTLLIVGKTKTYRLEKGQTIHADDMLAGTYEVRLPNFEKVHTLEIVGIDAIDFIEDAIVYDKGLPTIPVRATNANLSALTWKFNEKPISDKKEVMIPAFNKGIAKVELEGMQNGCAVKASYNVTVKEDYNLLAVNAFNIDSRDERNKTFLPYALYERNDAFDMQIIDPKTGEVIFKTNSIENPWNGIDSRTGELVPANSRYIWTVKLAKTANFEPKGVYQGVIVRVTY